MAFGESVTALIDTYSNCLKLLKAFNRRNGSEDEVLLRKSIKSDRAKVRRAYSSRLSERGDRLEKGDSEWPHTSSSLANKILMTSVWRQSLRGPHCVGFSSGSQPQSSTSSP